jgi:hypothetical protein
MEAARLAAGVAPGPAPDLDVGPARRRRRRDPDRVRGSDLELRPVRRAHQDRRRRRGPAHDLYRRRLVRRQRPPAARAVHDQDHATAGVSISAGEKELFGVDLRTRIDGPQPWYATGQAEFTFFGIDVAFGFDIGDEPGGEPREKHDVATDVSKAVAPPTGWQAVDSGDSWAGGVVVDDEWPPGLWARPDQLVEVRQSVAPLNRTMTAFGEYIPAPALIEATDVTLGGQPVASPAWVDDWFAPAQSTCWTTRPGSRRRPTS